jgi:hypothetical protein
LITRAWSTIVTSKVGASSFSSGSSLATRLSLSYLLACPFWIFLRTLHIPIQYSFRSSSIPQVFCNRQDSVARWNHAYQHDRNRETAFVMLYS